MRAHLRVVGTSYALGKATVSNVELAKTLKLQDDWFVTRTGILERRVCAADENVLTLACDTVQRACDDAKLDPKHLSRETLLLHIQNGAVALTPPSGIVLAAKLGMHSVRVTSIDGVCAEPIVALEHATLMLERGLCERVILSAAVDFMNWVRPDDPTTAGLFGAGGGCMILERGSGPGLSIELSGLSWETHASYSRLGWIPVHDCRQTPEGVSVRSGYYDMNGQGLARVGVKVIPPMVANTLADAGMEREELQVFISHQPNVRLLEIAVRTLRLEHCNTPSPCETIGNLGPASLFVNFAMAREKGLLAPGTKALLLTFGLGFSCGSAALQF